jgi:hypothetical protein
MTTTSYDPEFVQSQGFGQSPENAAPSLFLESIAIDKDCSVYGSLFVTNNGTFGGNVTIQQNLNLGGSIFASGTINGGSNANFSGIVAAAGFVSANPLLLPGASIGGALSKFSGAMNIGGLLNAAGGIVSDGQILSPLMQVAEKFVIGEQPNTNQEQSGEPKLPAEFYFNQQRYTPQQIFDSRSGEYYTVLAVSNTNTN